MGHLGVALRLVDKNPGDYSRAMPPLEPKLCHSLSEEIAHFLKAWARLTSVSQKLGSNQSMRGRLGSSTTFYGSLPHVDLARCNH
jgi:hypothetical protein